ncbi:hypothetical protein LOK74_10875 [Brevibacillus humidisoli]|uniref:hypothetical protein n=1 Tax=Brevibacillus humidisoli TaxID=2895522 RepID=UPI001E2F3C7E|nr:hypothetical protein [Brevibacillus humidisoli]UFJ42956.1 hypothetical protein LOK74_10875 [Brevibacillus humidisoli]
MLLEDGFRMLSEATKQAIAEEQNRRLGEILPTLVGSRLVDRQVVQRLWESCTEIEREAARCFLLEAVQGFFTKKQWDLLTAKRHAHLSLGLTGLRRIGFVLTVRKLWSDIGFLMPREVREILLLMLLDEAEASVPLASHEMLSYYTTSGRGIHLDLFSFLLFVRDQDVPVTRRQTIHRRVLQKLQPLLSCDDRHVGSWFERLFSPDLQKVYRAAEGVILDLALRLGLVRMDGRRLVLVEQAAVDWLAQSQEQRRRELLSLVMNYYLPGETWLEAAALHVVNSEEGRWHSLTALLDRLERAGFSLPADAVERVRGEWLHPLLGFDWIQLGLDGDGELWWRLPIRCGSDSDDPVEPTWYVEATGDVIVPPLIPLDQLWAVSQFGMLHFEGDLIRCTLLPEKVQAFVLSGGEQQQIEALLASRCPYPLPPGVCAMMERWIKQAKQIRVEAWARVSTADARILEELREIPLIRPFIWEIISETDFLVPLSQQADLLEALRQCGYVPQGDGLLWSDPQLAGSPTAQAAVPETKENAGLFVGSSPWQTYQVENVYPDRLEGIPQLAALPQMWTKHFQSYHPQTMRDLFKRAKELQLTVRVETVEGAEWEGVPQKVEVEMGYWSITMEVERKREKVRLDDIRRVRLILPDYVGDRS